MPTDFKSEGLLEGLDGPAREARLELLEKLEEGGVPVEELRQAAAEGRLPLVPVERALLGGGKRFTVAEVAERSGLPEAFLQRLWRALGMALADPGERAYTEADLAAAERVKAFRDSGLDDGHIIELTRMMSRSMSTVAVGIGSVFADTFLRAGDNEHDLAVRYAEASKAMLPLVGPTLEHVLQIQQLANIRQVAMDRPTLESGSVPGAQEMAVSFADLVGFTKLGERVAAAELGAVAERLEEMAAEVAEQPVRLVKTIGDAVMLGSRDADALVSATLRLVDAAEREAEGFPQLRAGVALGETLGRAGDLFGHPVNLASRITGIARPGSVLTTEEVTEAVPGERYRFSFAGARRLKGVDGETRLFRVRESSPGDEEG